MFTQSPATTITSISRSFLSLSPTFPQSILGIVVLPLWVLQSYTSIYNVLKFILILHEMFRLMKSLASYAVLWPWTQMKIQQVLLKYNIFHIYQFANKSVLISASGVVIATILFQRTILSKWVSRSSQSSSSPFSVGAHSPDSMNGKQTVAQTKL